MTSLSDRARTLNTLICLLKEVQGYRTTVELRKECSVTGQLDKVDEKMNITMSDVIFTDVDETETKYSLFYIQGKNVRYVHIPDDIDMIKAIQAHVTGIDKNVANRQERRPRKTTKERNRLQREVLERKHKELMQKLGMATNPHDK